MASVGRSKSDMWIGAGLLAFCAFAAWRTLEIRQVVSTTVAGPSFVPWLMIGGTALLSCALILRSLKNLHANGEVAEVSLPDKATFKKIAAFVALLIAYAAAYFPIGYIPATLVAFIAGLWLVGERNIWVLIGFPVAMTLVVYFAFTELLSVWLP